MEDQIIGVHVLVMLYLALYGIVTRKSEWDYVYLIVVYSVWLLWTFHNGECIISLKYKYLENPEYDPGEDPNSELKWAFPEYIDYIKIFESARNILLGVSMYIVYRRNHIPPNVYVPFVLLATLYVLRSNFFPDCYNQQECSVYEKIIQYGLILYAIYILSLWKSGFPGQRPRSTRS
jgi:hypothetical protein